MTCREMRMSTWKNGKTRTNKLDLGIVRKLWNSILGPRLNMIKEGQLWWHLGFASLKCLDSMNVNFYNFWSHPWIEKRQSEMEYDILWKYVLHNIIFSTSFLLRFCNLLKEIFCLLVLSLMQWGTFPLW
jgi:hypothetical protein